MASTQNGQSTEGSLVKHHKRLVILCDGTWQNADADPGNPLKQSPPSNITRLARAIKPVSKSGGQKIDQVLFYMSGVGTGVLDGAIGGLIGVGLSEKVRQAYGFLANNYNKGDTIAIFGFSRGAYTARSIAGLITKMGLLTKRGMDNFPYVYDQYYNHKDHPDHKLSDSTVRKLGLITLPANTITVVGVFDTVPFHRPFTGNIRWLNRFLGEQYELPNSELPDGVEYAFHALSLDESRRAFTPELWYKNMSKPPHETTSARPRKTHLEQCWFSGDHTDIGGGKKDSRLSNIPLAWMISKLEEHNLLKIDPNYLLERNIDKAEHYDQSLWATSRGECGKWYETAPRIARIALTILYFFIDIVVDVLRRFGFKNAGAIRTPGMYRDGACVTEEYIHSSIEDRGLQRLNGPNKVAWRCKALEGFERTIDPKTEKKWWTAPEKTTFDKRATLREAEVSAIERRCKNNIRDPVRNANLTLADQMYTDKVYSHHKIFSPGEKTHGFDIFVSNEERIARQKEERHREEDRLEYKNHRKGHDKLDFNHQINGSQKSDTNGADGIQDTIQIGQEA